MSDEPIRVTIDVRGRSLQGKQQPFPRWRANFHLQTVAFSWFTKSPEVQTVSVPMISNQILIYDSNSKILGEEPAR